MALLCGELMAVVVMRPGGEHEQTAFGAGIKLFAVRLGKWGEAIFHDDDGGEFGVEGCAHDAFLAGRDGRGDEDGAGLGCAHVAVQFLLQLGFVVAARDTNGKAMGSAKKGKIADAVVDVRAYAKVEEGAKVFRVGALHEQAAGIVFDVVDQGGEHVIALADQVVVVRLEEEAVVAVFVALAGGWSLRHCRSILRARVTYSADWHSLQAT